VGASVGYVLTLSGPTEDFELLRNSRPIPIAVNKPLEKGDKIKVVKESHQKGTTNYDNSVTLLLGMGELVTLTHKETQSKSYRVENSQQVPSVLGNFIASLAKSFNGWQEHHVHLISVYTRGNQKNRDPLRMPLLASSQNKLLAGKKTLSLSWLDGQPPYQVRVTLQGSKQSWHQSNLSESAVTLVNISLSSGSYLTEISDATGQSVKGTFQVVTDSPILQNEEVKAIQNKSLPENSRRTLLASWLAQHQDWRLEAYQQVAEIADQFYPALLVKEGLAGGK